MAITFPNHDLNAAKPPFGRGAVKGGAEGRPSLRSTLTGWAFCAPATLLILGLSVFPAGWAFFLSLQKNDLITPATNVGFANYKVLAQDPDMFAAAWHTLFYALMYVPTSVIGGLLLAIALNRPIKFQWFYRTCIFVPFVASAAATGILANFVFDEKFGAANNVLRLMGLPQQGFLTDKHQAMMVIVIISLWGSIGFCVLTYLAALQDVSQDILDAARVDGANKWQTFRYVTLPELGPVTVFTAVWQLIAAIQLFDLVFTTTKGQPLNSTVTLVFYLYRMAFMEFKAGYASAIAYAIFAITMILTLFMVWYGKKSKVEAF